MQQVTNMAILRAKSGNSEALGELLMALVEPSRAEPGCLAYEVHRANDDDDMWMLYETWASATDVRDHFHSAHVRAFALAVAPLLDDKPDLHSFSRVSPSVWPARR